MTLALIAGGLAGLGVFGVIRALFPVRPGLSGELADYDARRSRMLTRTVRTAAAPTDVSGWRLALGSRVAALLAGRGLRFPSTRANLSLVGRSFEGFVATKVLLAAGGLVFIPLMLAYFAILGVGVPPAIPVWGGLLVALGFFVIPDMQLRQEAAARRRDFRHVVGGFLDLVALNLSGGRGVPEALMAAADIGQGWAMARIRDALANARITGQTPWQALGQLGEEIDVDELRDLSSALGLVAEDGAKIRQSLAARAASMRRRELSDLEGKAGERSQAMLVAQMLLCAGYLLFLAYPAVMRVMGR